MTEVKIAVPGNHLMVGLLGQRDELLRLVEDAFPDASVVVRGNEINVRGDDARAAARTFEELFRRAAVVLGSGRGVILDATFRERALRSRAQDLARLHGRRFVFAEAVADEGMLRDRLRRRAAGPSVSDAGESLLERVRAEFEPVTELAAGEHIRVDTTGPPEAAVRTLLGVLAA